MDKLRDDRRTQRDLVTKCIEHLEIAKSYLLLAEGYAVESVNVLSADLESWDISNLITRGEYMRSCIGTTWEIGCDSHE